MDKKKSYHKHFYINTVIQIWAVSFMTFSNHTTSALSALRDYLKTDTL